MVFQTQPAEESAETDAGERRPFVQPRDLEQDREALAGAPMDVLLSQHLIHLYGTDAFDEITTTFFDENFEVLDLHTDSGGILIRPNGNQDYGLDVTGSSVEVAGLDDAQRLTDAGLETTLLAATFSRTLPGAEAGIYVYDNNPEVQLTMMLAAERAGLTVMNDNAVMNELPPEIAAQVDEYRTRMDAAWDRVYGDGTDTATEESALDADPENDVATGIDADVEAGLTANETTYTEPFRGPI